MTYIENGIEYSEFMRNGKLFKRKLVKPCVTHGKSNSRIYDIWKGIRRRCHNPNAPKYEYYGGKGIKVCDEWRYADKNGFENFYNWAIENGYSDNLTIDRIDSEGDYCPENCQWLTHSENVSKSAVLPTTPKYEYFGINDTLGLSAKFYKLTDFKKYFGIDTRRISDCLCGTIESYEGWVFTRQKLSWEEGQETIRQRSTGGRELPLEVRNVHNNKIVYCG